MPLSMIRRLTLWKNVKLKFVKTTTVNKIYHLSTCNTCQRIIKELGGADKFELQNIKTEQITPEQLAEMREKTDSYESLFTRRSRQWSARGLKDQTLGEEDFKNLILDEYTFLKRPVVLIGDEIFIGNSKKVVEAAKEKLG